MRSNQKWRQKTSPATLSLDHLPGHQGIRLQGKRAGKVYLRKLQEKLFIDKLDISESDVLFTCAEEAKLDMQEFEEDIISSSAKQAYQCDLA